MYFAPRGTALGKLRPAECESAGGRTAGGPGAAAGSESGSLVRPGRPGPPGHVI